MGGRFEHSADVSAGGWIAPRLGGGFGAVGRVCPRGFEAYARVFHPVGDDGMRWCEVAATMGRTAHPLMQWARISGLFYGTRMFGDWQGDQPVSGALGSTRLAALAAAIGGDAPVTLGVWTGYGDLAHSVRSSATLDLPGREYALYRGRLEALRDSRWSRAGDWPTSATDTPNLAWPDDHSWFIASEIDFDSTVVGGTRELVDRVLASDLETAEVTETSDLSSEGDTINPAGPLP